jgi:hypothetical protein
MRRCGLTPSHDVQCFSLGPFAHVEPDLTDHDQGGGLIDALNPCHVSPCHAMQWLPWIERWSVAVAAPLATLGRQWFAMALVSKGRHMGRKAGITGSALPMLELIALQRLLQGTQRLAPPRALQGGGNGSLVLLAAGITPPRALRRVTFPSEDGPNDREPSDAGNVADDVLQLDVHLRQGFLHGLDVARRIGQQHRPLPERTAQDDDLILRPKARRQQAVGMEALEPRAILHVGRGAAVARHRAGVDQQPLEPPDFQQRKEGDPVDPRGLQGDRGHTTVPKPVRHRFEVGRMGSLLPTSMRESRFFMAYSHPYS